ncbi:MAG: glycosyltransferase family 2 protein, partial [Kiloniellales bacterium]
MTAQTGDTIDILLATYNGQAFLEEQLDSIAAQTHGDWRLIARDDGSTDRTPEILDAFRTRHPGKVVVLEDGDGNLGLVRNFSRLMAYSDAPYAAFCDQDDVWIPEKLDLSLAKMRELEREHGNGTPLLVFTDLTVVDEGLEVVHDSFWRYADLDPAAINNVSNMMIGNVVTGCTLIMNEVLRDSAVPIPDEAVVHDWWIAASASMFGKAAHIDRPTVLYRQHGGNSMGAVPYHKKSLSQLIRDFAQHYQAKKDDLSAAYRQTEALRDRHEDRLAVDVRHFVERFLAMRDHNIVWRLRECQAFDRLRDRPLRALSFAVLSSRRRL